MITYATNVPPVIHCQLPPNIDVVSLEMFAINIMVINVVDRRSVLLLFNMCVS